MEQGGCNVVQGNTVNQRAAYVRRLAAVGLTLLAAAVVLAALVGGSTPEANQVSACARSGRAAGKVRASVAGAPWAPWAPLSGGGPGALSTLPGRQSVWCRASVVAWANMLTFPCLRHCVAVSLCVRARQLAISKLYSATGWDSIYGGSSGSSTNSDAWHDSSGSDDTGARTNILHEDGDSDSDSDDTDPDSAKNDVHWNAAGGSTSKTAVSDDDSSADDSASVGQAKMAKASASSGSGQKAAKATVAAKKGKPDTTDALIKLSQV